MTDKQRGAAAAALFCLAIVFVAMAIHAAWNQDGQGLAVSLLFVSLFAKAGYLAWSAKL
jgi:hypothetical protein